MHNKFPLWKNLLLIALVVFGILYSVPSLFVEEPAVQVAPKGTQPITGQLVQNIKGILQASKLKYLSVMKEKAGVVVRFPNLDIQLKARDDIKAKLGNQYLVSLTLASRTPSWLKAIGAHPIKLGLDLRGGVHLLLDVDVDALIKGHEEGDIRTVGQTLRAADIRYAGIQKQLPNGIIIMFRNQNDMLHAYNSISSNMPNYQLFKITQKAGHYEIRAVMKQTALVKIGNYAIGQAMNIIRNRVDALGVGEAVIQRQGRSQISVELPGIQDTAEAESIIGKVATLRFQMVDEKHDVQSALAGNIPVGSQLLYTKDKRPVLVYDRVILGGDSITYATASIGEDGRPAVQVRLGSGDIAMFNRITSENVGKSMAVIYVETKSERKKIDGQTVTVRHQIERVISVATIQSALGSNFQITNLQSSKYAQNLALLLRSGALLAPINIIQERNVGPSMGADNIHKGLVSVVVGFLAAVIFMIFYYHFFGLVADIALLLNLIFIVAVFSFLGVTLSLPGIAAMVLTVGMAVDANVLIYERIREELRNGVSPQASIHIGYDRALSTIIDANVTTLIVALVLYAIGTSSVKGFAVTLIVGLLASMLTSITYTRAIVNKVYGGRVVKKLSIGI